MRRLKEVSVAIRPRMDPPTRTRQLDPSKMTTRKIQSYPTRTGPESDSVAAGPRKKEVRILVTEILILVTEISPRDLMQVRIPLTPWIWSTWELNTAGFPSPLRLEMLEFRVSVGGFGPSVPVQPIGRRETKANVIQWEHILAWWGAADSRGMANRA